MTDKYRYRKPSVDLAVRVKSKIIILDPGLQEVLEFPKILKLREEVADREDSIKKYLYVRF